MLGNTLETYKKIEELSANLGFVGFGCARVEDISNTAGERYLAMMQKGHFAKMEYLGRNLEKRFNPALLVEGAKSILVFLVPYSLPKSEVAPKGVAGYALGLDYHTIIKGRLFAIMEEMKRWFPDFSGRAFTDSAPVLEREWGVKCGLGFIGKNNFLINRECGIKNFIAVIICNLEIPPTLELFPERGKNMENGCGKCSKCLKSCPTGALCSAFEMNANRCISYHTIENRDFALDVANGDLPKFSGPYFGCDGCLDACPWNSKNRPGWDEFHTNVGLLSNATHEWWKNLDEGDFKKIFKDSPLLRGGIKNINAALEWGQKCGKNE